MPTQRELIAYSAEEVSKHNKQDDLWVSINDRVYDLTKFVKYHPGGIQPLLEYAGQDASEVFHSVHRSDVLNRYERFQIGVLSPAKYPDPKDFEEASFS